MEQAYFLTSPWDQTTVVEFHLPFNWLGVPGKGKHVQTEGLFELENFRRGEVKTAAVVKGCRDVRGPCSIRLATILSVGAVENKA